MPQLVSVLNGQQSDADHINQLVDLYRGDSVYDVKAGFGAAGDGVTDDQPAIQAAIDAAGLAGGGTVWIPRGTYYLSSFEVVAPAAPAHLHNPYSNVSIMGSGSGSILKCDDGGSDHGIIYQGQTSKFVNATVYAITASIARNATSVFLATPAQTSNFSVGHYVYLRTGQTVGLPGQGFVSQPDAEINRVTSINAGTGEIGLAWPTAKPYAQEYYISGTADESSTTVTANAAVFGLANINSLVTINQTYRDLRFETSEDPADVVYGMIGGQTVYSLSDNISYRGNSGMESCGAHRFRTVRSSTFDHPGAAGTYIYTLTGDSGCTDTLWDGNTFTGEHVVSVHIQEGHARVRCLNNVWSVPDTVSDLNHISIRSRAYDVSVIGNIHSGSTPSVIVVDPDCTGGGLIANNQLLGSTGYGVFIAAPNWMASGNRHPNGAKFWALGSTGIDADQRQLGGWVTSSNQTVFMGILPANCYVKATGVQVTVAFNSSGTDNVTIGSDTLADAFGQAVDVSTTGFKTPALGGYAGYSPAVHGQIKAFYTNGGTEPSQGKAFCWLEYAPMPESP
jgi:hypothetical protein